jgi:hypothetical protein
MTYARVALIAAVAAVATILLGWWSAAAIGIVVGLVTPAGRRAGLEAGASAALGWGAILAASAVSGPIWAVAQRVGPVFSVPAVGFLAVALVFPALLAGSAALVAADLRRFTGAAGHVRRPS